MKKKALLPILGVLAAFVALSCALPAASYAVEDPAQQETGAVSIAYADIEMETSYVCTGEVIVPELVVTLYNEELQAGVDYTVSYTRFGGILPVDPVDAGYYVVWVKGDGVNYVGYATKTFKIVKPVDITGEGIAFSYDGSFTDDTDSMSVQYDGTYQTPEFYVGTYNSSEQAYTALEYGVDYEIDYQAAVYPGIHEFTVNGIGFYTGSKTFYYSIWADLSQCKIALSSTVLAYNGKIQKPALSSVILGKRVVASKFLNVKYVSNSKYAGTYKVVVTSNSPYYEGSKTLAYVINPAVPTIKSLVGAQTSFKISFSALPSKLGATGYTIFYKKVGAKTWSYKNASTKTNVVGGLSKGTYYVKVRAYKTYSSKIYRGEFTKTVKVTIR